MFVDYYIFPYVSQSVLRGGVAVLFRKELHHEVREIFGELDGKLMVLHVSNSKGGDFRLVVVYIPTGAARRNVRGIWKNF